MTILIILLLALLFGASLVTVTFSYAFAWYETANRHPELLEGRFSAPSLLFALRLVLVEALLLTITLILHPLGWYTRRRERLPRAIDPPILLLHGLFQSRACWLWLRLLLWLRGYRNVYALSLPPTRNIETLTEILDRKIIELRHKPGIEKVHLVGHSMGGMIARNYVQLRGGGDKVASLTLLSSPNSGSRLAPFAVTKLGLEALPGSDFLQRLGTALPPEDIPVINIYCRHDNIIVPAEFGYLEWATNVELQGVGHTSVLFMPRSVRAILASLKEHYA